jgi:flagellar protein FliO/FliZ
MDSVELVGRVLVSLVVVLAVIWVLARKFRKSANGGKRKGVGLIDVLGRQQLSRTASVAVVRVGSQALVVGITETQVNVLGETDLAAALAEVSVAPPARSTRVDVGRRPSAPIPAPIPAPGIPAPGAANVPVPGRDSRPLPAARASVAGDGADRPRGPLAGSALSPATWRQTIESLRDLTAH